MRPSRNPERCALLIVNRKSPARFDVRPGALHVLAADPASADAADTNRSTSATAH